MKTKIEIIQDLLDKRAITAQEAMTLMQAEKEYVYYNWPSYPIWQSTPYSIPCTGTFPNYSTGTNLIVSTTN